MQRSLQKEVSRLSHGKMKIEVYPNSTLGGDRELLESCKDGDIPFVVQNTAPQVTFLPDTAVFDLPSAFTTIQQARAAVDNEEFYQKMEKVYQKGGYKLLGYADQGFRVMSTNKNVKSINDFKGQKIRTMENSYHLKFWKTLWSESNTNDIQRSLYRTSAGNDRCTGESLRSYRFQQII